jgi:superfamily II RNA helicase
MAQRDMLPAIYFIFSRRSCDRALRDLNKLCLRVLGSEEGQKLMGWLRAALLEQPVAVPGSDPSFAFYREGQNSVVRDLEARIKKARSL